MSDIIRIKRRDQAKTETMYCCEQHVKLAVGQTVCPAIGSSLKLCLSQLSGSGIVQPAVEAFSSGLSEFSAWEASGLVCHILQVKSVTATAAMIRH